MSSVSKLFRRAAALVAAACIALIAAPLSAQPPPIPATPREFRGLWIATVQNIDWPNRSQTPSQQQAALRAAFDRAVEARLNAIIFQVRTAGDAFYQSDLEPWSYWLSGRNLQEGTAPSPVWDPLAFAIAEARARGLELHAWFNPFRAKRGSSSHDYRHDPKHIAVRQPTWVYPYGDQQEWMDPGIQGVQDWSAQVILDVVNRYDIDAVHFDDYFYPYPVSGVTFPDNGTYAAYQAAGGTLSLANWRRDNVNRFIQRVYNDIRAAKPHVRFGISPFGIWRPGNPPGITGLDAYSTLYADSRLWLQQGWLDYFAPQLYWRIEQPGQEYPKLLDWWISQNTRNRHMWPGLFTSQIQAASWPVSEVINQIAITQQRTGATGNIHFSERALRTNYNAQAGLLISSLQTQVYTSKALVPATTWLDATPPAAPTVRFARAANGAITLSWTNAANEPIRNWVVHYHDGTAWQYDILPASATSLALPGTGAAAPRWAAVTAVDRVGNESARAVVTLTTPDAWKSY
jgi:uncharacterized lipoprotein YddW (UPF0748 family)